MVLNFLSLDDPKSPQFPPSDTSSHTGDIQSLNLSGYDETETHTAATDDLSAVTESSRQTLHKAVEEVDMNEEDLEDEDLEDEDLEDSYENSFHIDTEYHHDRYYLYRDSCRSAHWVS